MKVFYLNDEQKPIMVRVQGLFDPVTGVSNDEFRKLEPCEGRVFDVPMANEGDLLWIKKWKDMVMLSHVSAVVMQELLLRQQQEDVV